MLRVTINGKSAKTALGIRVPSKDWDVKRSRCRLREHTESKRINIFLENALSKCNRAYTSLQGGIHLHLRLKRLLNHILQKGRKSTAFTKKVLARPSRARTCDHLIMSQVTNFSNNPRSNHFVKLSNINGFELIATIPAIAQAMYGIYRTINYD